MYQKTFLFFIFLALCQFVKAQVGPTIISPQQNSTVEPGKNVEIVFEYQNIGTGNYTIDIQLWQNAAVSIPISNVLMDQTIPPGNSTGVKLFYTLNSTYSWKVPHGLNDTFWLTVTETAVTPFFSKGVNIRSRPLMLHTSAANLMTKPRSIAILLFLSFATLIMFS